MKKILIALAMLIGFSSQATADFTISVNYTGDPQYQGAFDSAAATWESLLSGYQNGEVVTRFAGSSYQVGDTVTTLFIDAEVSFIDGAGGILGFAGPTSAIIDQLGYTLSTDGSMTFDSADAPGLGSAFEAVVLHEMAHVMGFGTLWDDNGVYVDGSGEFTGANALAKWQTEFGQTSDTFVPVELGGGGGTANGHWNEVDGGAGLTGITDSQGRDMRDELMTGWLNSNSFISEMTVGSFVDIGFEAAAIPEPSSLMLLGVAGLGFAFRRRRS